MKSLRLVLSKSYDPWFNLALEELLYDTIPENTVIPVSYTHLTLPTKLEV